MSNRVQYTEGSSLPHFVGDKHTMTADEGAEFITSRAERRVAISVEHNVIEFLATQLYFRGAISEIVAEEAREIMGHDRPLSDDDVEYYKLCERIFNSVVNRLHRAISIEMNK
jgi:hypothetical protein